jgi:hypothetical protein
MCLHGVDRGFCADDQGKIKNDSLPVDVCGTGTYRAPCYEGGEVKPTIYHLYFTAVFV